MHDGAAYCNLEEAKAMALVGAVTLMTPRFEKFVVLRLPW